LGDLALRKLFPALYQLDREGLLHEDTRIMALARDQGDGVKQLEHIEERLRHYVPKADWDEAVWTRMRGRLGYRAIDFRNREDYTGLAEDVGETSPLIAYFATPALSTAPSARTSPPSACASAPGW